MSFSTTEFLTVDIFDRRFSDRVFFDQIFVPLTFSIEELTVEVFYHRTFLPLTPSNEALTLEILVQQDSCPLRYRSRRFLSAKRFSPLRFSSEERCSLWGILVR